MPGKSNNVAEVGLMGVRNGRTYIVSVSITPEMHDFINSRKKGSRSAFIRRAIYNAETYDMQNRIQEAQWQLLEEQISGLLTMVAYQQSRLNRILSEGEDYPNFLEWVMTDGSYTPMMDKQAWRDARDAIDGLTRHIESLSNVLRVLEGTEGGSIEGV